MSKKNTQAIRATEGQLKQIVRIIEDALPDRKWIEELIARLYLDKYDAQEFIESGNELHTVRKFLTKEVENLSVSIRGHTQSRCGAHLYGLYRDQEVKSGYGYYSKYRNARPIDEQIAILRQYDWGHEVDWSLNKVQKRMIEQPKPEGSEGYFAVVFDSSMVTYVKEDPLVDQSGPFTYAINALFKQREQDQVNHLGGNLGASYYRRNKQSARKMRVLWEFQERPSGIILIPAQLGIYYRGKSVLRSRALICQNELPLDAYETIQMVLTHENRLADYYDLWLELPGSEYSRVAGGNFRHALCLSYANDKVEFGFGAADNVSDRYGSVSGFLPGVKLILELLSVGYFCILVLRGSMNLKSVRVIRTLFFHRGDWSLWE